MQQSLQVRHNRLYGNLLYEIRYWGKLPSDRQKISERALRHPPAVVCRNLFDAKLFEYPEDIAVIATEIGRRMRIGTDRDRNTAIDAFLQELPLRIYRSGPPADPRRADLERHARFEQQQGDPGVLIPHGYVRPEVLTSYRIGV